MKQVSVFVPESAVIEAISPAYRLFKTANQFLAAAGRDPLFKVEYVGLSTQVQANDGEYSIRTDRLLQDLQTTDLFIIPALYGDLDKAIQANAAAFPRIRQLYSSGAEIASLCIGAFLLAETGLVAGKKCSTHWAYYDEFRKRYPDTEMVDGTVITDEGRLYSSGGANSLWNLLLYLLEKYTNREIAILAAKYFAIDIDRNSQAAFTIFTGQKDHKDAEILQAQQIMESSYSDKLTIESLADQLNIGRRSFERRFKLATNNTPIEYMQRIRIEAAKRSFEVSRKNVSEVMFDVGYNDNKAFRDVFKKITGLTPVEYRNKYNKFESLIF
ncbi:MAG: helix-turn-helix domain-containing protein [Chitinophagaceae bacterium]|nr:helix-turn-helix domain-containing protein [Chitinophagaceae bacterium]